MMPFFVLTSVMEAILKKLGLGNLCETFHKERITPDIIGLLSAYELRQLGVHSSSDMMALRIAASTFGSLQIKKVRASCGPPKFDIPRSVLENLLDEGFLIKEISTMLSVSESTIFRRMSMYGLSKLAFTDIMDEELDVVLKEIVIQFPYCGYNMLKQMLLDKGVKVARMRVR